MPDWNDNAAADLDELERMVREAITALANQHDPAAFHALLRLSGHLGYSLGVSARTVASATSWARVADAAGTTRQAAWSRWKA